MPILSENWRMRPKHSWYSKIVRKYYKIRVNLTKPRNPIPDRDILEKAEKEKRLVIQIPFGGLGDHLAYSSLPELLWEQKGIRTFISKKSVFRNQAICDFVWGYNPYVSFTEEKGWFTYEPLRTDLPTLDSYFQDLFGLKGDGLPKVYYRPQSVEALKGKTIVDPSCGAAGKANGYFEQRFYEEYIRYLRKHISDFVLIKHAHDHHKTNLERIVEAAFSPEVYEVNTIEKLADVLFSAKNRYLLHSGACSLCAALRLHAYVLNYLKPAAYISYKFNLHTYVDLNPSRKA